jgi:hypothetical protein
MQQAKASANAEVLAFMSAFKSELDRTSFTANEKQRILQHLKVTNEPERTGDSQK